MVVIHPSMPVVIGRRSRGQQPPMISSSVKSRSGTGATSKSIYVCRGSAERHERIPEAKNDRRIKIPPAVAQAPRLIV